MNTIIFVVIMTVASLTMALLFAGTVLSLRWWKLIVIHRHPKNRNNNNSNNQNQQLNVDTKLVSNSASTINAEARIKSKSKSQTLVQLKRMSDLNKLLDKTVITCERADLGRVVAIDNQSMTVIHHTKQEYIIPTYYMREYNGENVVIDISIRYIYHYKSEEKLQEPYIQKQK